MRNLHRLLTSQFLLSMWLAAAALGQSSAPMTKAEQQDYLHKLEKILPPVPSWTEWQEKTGTLPFAADLQFTAKAKRVCRSAGFTMAARSDSGGLVRPAARRYPLSRKNMSGELCRRAPR